MIGKNASDDGSVADPILKTDDANRSRELQRSNRTTNICSIFALHSNENVLAIR